MTTASDVIKSARRSLNIDSVGDSVSSDEMFEGLDLLNQMLDNWTNHRLAIYYTRNELYTLATSVQTYTIGLSNRVVQGNLGTFTSGSILVTINGVSTTQTWATSKVLTMAALANTLKSTQYAYISNATYNGTTDALTLTNNGADPLTVTVTVTPGGGDTITYSLTALSTSHIEAHRPIKITGAFVRLYVSVTDPIDYQLTMIGSDQYQQIVRKNLTTTYPQFLYYQPTYPVGNLTFYPIPTTQLSLGLNQTYQFVRLANLTASVSLPPGYEKALIYNLAIEMAPRYGKSSAVQTGSVIWTQAKESLADVKRTNIVPDLQNVDPVLTQNGGIYNIFSDTMNQFFGNQ